MTRKPHGRPRHVQSHAMSLREYAKKSERPSQWIKCSTCSNAELAKHVAEYYAMREAGELKMWQSIPWFIRWLRDQHGIKAKAGAVGNHLRNCLGSA